MSKAFTKEDDAPDDDERPEARRPPQSPYITPEGHRALQVELEQLWRVERPRVTAEVAAAAALGDRSENAEYIYGKKRLREIDRRIEWLSRRLDQIKVVEASAEQAGRAFFGAWVTVEDEDGERHEYRIVGTDEIDLDRGWISVVSPLAKALLGKAEGQTVVVMRPRGAKEYEIVRIRYGAS